MSLLCVLASSGYQSRSSEKSRSECWSARTTLRAERTNKRDPLEGGGVIWNRGSIKPSRRVSVGGAGKEEEEEGRGGTKSGEGKERVEDGRTIRCKCDIGGSSPSLLFLLFRLTPPNAAD